MPSTEASPLKDAIMDAVYVPLERDDMQTPCTLPFMTSSEHGVCDGDGCPVSDETIAGALNAVARIQTEYYKVKKETQKGTQKEMTAEPSPRPWRVVRTLGLREEVERVGIVSADDRTVAVFGPDEAESANLIVDAVNQIGNARGIAKTAVNEYAELGERYNRLLSAMKAIEDLCKVLDRTDLWEAREEWLDDAIYYIRKEARAAIKENEQC